MEKQQKKRGNKANSHFDFLFGNKNLLNSKCSQASIIVIILIILIVLIASLIIWNIVMPLIKEKGEEVETSEKVLGVNFDVKEAILFANGASKVSVERKAGKGEVEGLKFIFYNEEDNSYVEMKEADLKELETKTYTFSPVPIGKIKKISVVPVFGKKLGREFSSEVDKIIEIPSGLVSWWRFDDEKDFVGNNHGDFANIIEDEERGKVANFNGFNAPINAGNSSDLSIEGKVGISFWVKTTGQGGIIKKSNGVKNYEVSLSEGKIKFSYTMEGGLKEGSSISEIDDGKWYHVVVSEDWEGDGFLRLYIDGSLDNMVLLIESPEINNENVLIGENFNGYIDELMFFNKALSKLEVEGLFSGQK